MVYVILHLIEGIRMGKGYHNLERYSRAELTRMFESKWIREKAREVGLIERERKIDPVIMFWTLAIGYGSQLYRTLTELKREYEVRGNVSISDSGWHDRSLPS